METEYPILLVENINMETEYPILLVENINMETEYPHTIGKSYKTQTYNGPHVRRRIRVQRSEMNKCFSLL